MGLAPTLQRTYNFKRLRGAYFHTLDDDECKELFKYDSKLAKIIESSRNLESIINRFCREGISML
jgi:hypothetical protein